MFKSSNKVLREDCCVWEAEKKKVRPEPGSITPHRGMRSTDQSSRWFASKAWVKKSKSQTICQAVRRFEPWSSDSKRQSVRKKAGAEADSESAGEALESRLWRDSQTAFRKSAVSMARIRGAKGIKDVSKITNHINGRMVFNKVLKGWNPGARAAQISFKGNWQRVDAEQSGDVRGRRPHWQPWQWHFVKRSDPLSRSQRGSSHWSKVPRTGQERAREWKAKE